MAKQIPQGFILLLRVAEPLKNQIRFHFTFR